MKKNAKTNFDFVANLVVELFEMDKLITYDFLVTELSISRTAVSEMKRGKDMYMCRYLKVINYVMKVINLRIDMCKLAKVLRKVLSRKYDLVVSVVPHHRSADYTPEEWVVILEWEASKKK